MDALICPGPAAELLAVIGVDDQTSSLVGARAELLHRLANVTEGNEVAKLHAAGEDDDRESLVLGDVGLTQLLRPESGLQEVLIVEDRVGDARLGEERREVRFPDPLSEPRPERALSEDRVNAIRERADLTHSVASRNSDEDRFVVAA